MDAAKSESLHPEADQREDSEGMPFTGRLRSFAHSGSGRPPHGFQRVLLTHWVLAPGTDVKALLGPGMQGTGTGNPSVDVAAHPLPARSVTRYFTVTVTAVDDGRLSTEILYLPTLLKRKAILHPSRAKSSTPEPGFITQEMRSHATLDDDSTVNTTVVPGRIGFEMSTELVMTGEDGDFG